MNTVRSVARTVWQHRIAVTCTLVFLLVAGLLAATLYTFNLPRFALDHQQTVVLGPTQFAPENPSALRVVVRDNETNQPISNANVTVQMIPKGGGASQTLYTGKTDARGTAPVSFVLPPNTARDQTLIIETNSDAGRDHVERAITVARSYKVLVTTDKPLYQPGQMIH